MRNLNNFYSRFKLYLNRFSEYVEVLHTNGFNLGLGGPIGHADFFPNFGRWQPGCGWWEVTGTCSHLRASELFAESINSSRFIAKRCASAEEIGKDRCTDQLLDERIVYQPEPTNIGLTGHFFFETYGEAPFARGWNRSKYFLNSNHCIVVALLIK